MTQRLYIRRFLNRRGHHAGGYILVSVEDTSKQPRDERAWPHVEFTIADCGRQISLDFPVGVGQLSNSLYKVDLLTEALARLRDALVEEGALEAERARAVAAKAPHAAPGG
jgi:hypothetical protein